MQLNPDMPPGLDAIINKALEKDRDVRYQHASELRADLKRLKRDTDSGRSAASVTAAGRIAAPAGQRRWLLPVAAAVILAAIGAFWLARPLPPPRIAGSTQITNDGRTKFAPTLTDGSRLYFVAMDATGNALYQTSVAGGEPVPYSHIFHSQVATLAGISPDGSQLLVHSGQGTNGSLGIRSLRHAPWLSERLDEQEADGRHMLRHRVGGQFSLAEQVRLVLADVLRA
jgi:hypothetical protein